MSLKDLKMIEAVHKAQKPNLFDNWADARLQLPGLKRSMV